MTLIQTFEGCAVVIRCPVRGYMDFINAKLPVHSAICPSPRSLPFISTEGHLHV